MSRARGLACVAAPLALGLGACAVNPVTGEQDFVLMSEAREIELGGRYHKAILERYGEYDDPAVQAYVRRIGQQLAGYSHRDRIRFHFSVLDTPEINAFALPGGYVYITRGIMAYLNSEAELAGVIGHEIGHVTARHSVRQHSQSTLTGILDDLLSVTGASTDDLLGALGQTLTSGYGREYELEADRLGAQYLARVGYSPDNMIEVIGVLKDQEAFADAGGASEEREPGGYHGVFASHPRNDRRLKEVVQAARRYRAENPLPDNREAYLAQIDGMVFGPSPAHGVVHGNDFYHPSLGFAFTAPVRWRIRNFPGYIALVPESRDAFLQFDMRAVRAGGDPGVELLNRLGTDSLDQGRALAGDFPAYTGLGEAQTPFGARTTRFVAWVVQDKVFMLAGAAQHSDDHRAYDEEFLTVARSFRTLSNAERARAAARRIAVVPSPAGGYAQAAEDSPLEDAPARLRLLNGDYPDGEATARRLIKVVR